MGWKHAAARSVDTATASVSPWVTPARRVCRTATAIDEDRDDAGRHERPADRPADDPVDVEEPVAEDGDEDGERDGEERGRGGSQAMAPMLGPTMAPTSPPRRAATSRLANDAASQRIWRRTRPVDADGCARAPTRR